MSDHHDASYKSLFQHAELVADLIRGFLPYAWVAKLDFDTLRQHQSSHVSSSLRQRHNDLLWSVEFRDEPDERLWLYLAFEFQTTVDPLMALRAATYGLMTYRDLARELRLGAGEYLPGLVMIVLYRGKKRWKAPLNLADLIHPRWRSHDALADLIPQIRYVLIDIHRIESASLFASGNLAAAVMEIEKASRLELFPALLANLRKWLKRGRHREIHMAFMEWLKRVVIPIRFPSVDREELKMLEDLKELQEALGWEPVENFREEGREEGRREGIQIGLERGLEQGHHRGETALLRRLLERRFGPLDASTLSRLEQADSDTLLEWGERVLDARNLEDVWREREH